MRLKDSRFYPRRFARIESRLKTAASAYLFSEITDNPVTILLTYGTTCVLLADDAEAREEEYMAGGPYTRP